MKLNDFKLMKETPEAYHVGHPKGKTIQIPKAGLSERSHSEIKKMQRFDGGGEVQPDFVGPPAPEQSQADVEPEDDSLAQREPAAAPVPEPAEAKTNAANNAFTAEQAANTAGARAVGQQGAEEAGIIDKAFSNPDVGPKGEIAGMPTSQDIIKAGKAKDDALMRAYMSKTIDPNHYWENKATGSKISAGLGMILGGMGSATTGQQNYAMENIHNAINNDIDAQKNAQGMAMNAWKMNREALGTDLAANLATRNQALTTLQYQLQAAGERYKGPIAAANAQGLNAKIEQEKQQNNIRLSLLNPTSDVPDPATRVPFLVPPEKQAKAFDEIDAAKATAQNGPAIMEAFDRAAKEVRPLTGGTGTSLTAFVPGMESPNQKAMHALMGPTFKDVEGTVRQAAMDNMNHNTTPQFGDDNSTIKTKRAALEGYLRSKSASASTAKGFGIDLTRFPMTHFVAAPPKGQAPEIRYDKNGQAWTLGPDGKTPIPVIPRQGSK